MQKKDIIYLDKQGYENFLLELEALKNELRKLRLEKSEAFKSSDGDGFHDNFAFEESERKERSLMYSINEKLKALQRIEIIEKKDSIENDEIVDINDVVSLTIDFGEKETALYRLSGTQKFSSENGIINISLNSPLGKAIYLKQVGETVEYSVNNQIFLVSIDSKENMNELQNLDNARIK